MGTNIAGRLVILKAVLDSIPIYWFNLYKVPVTVINKIDKIRRDFLWNGLIQDSNKMHLLSWSKVCMSKSEGGLGITSLKNRNISLLAKWWWRYRKDSNSLWNRILLNKYGEWENIDSRSNLSPIMKGIISISSFSSLKLFSRKDFFWIMGNGTKVKFWLDIWTGNSTLKERFPRLFDLCILKDANVYTIHQHWSNSRTLRIWRRTLRQWEQEEESELVKILEESNPSNLQDKIFWSCNRGDYVTSEGYNKLCHLNETDGMISNHWNWIWKSKIPPKIKVFLWKINHRIIPTKFFLSRRGLNLNSLACSWCNHIPEHIEHLFWECPLATTLWAILFQWTGINSFRMPNDIFCLNHLFMQKQGDSLNKFWPIFVSSILWTIWRVRNNCTFNSKRVNSDNMSFMLKATVYKWIRSRGWAPALMDGYENLWINNPFGFLKLQVLNKRISLMTLLHQSFDLIGFSDGAWYKDNQGVTFAGIGGIIFGKNNQKLFILSGPSQAISPLEVEKQACFCLIDEVSKSKFAGAKMVICSDSYWLKESFVELKNRNQNLYNYSVIQCDREIITEADFLAKNGVKLSMLRKEWLCIHNQGTLTD